MAYLPNQRLALDQGGRSGRPEPFGDDAGDGLVGADVGGDGAAARRRRASSWSRAAARRRRAAGETGLAGGDGACSRRRAGWRRGDGGGATAAGETGLAGGDGACSRWNPATASEGERGEERGDRLGERGEEPGRRACILQGQNTRGASEEMRLV